MATRSIDIKLKFEAFNCTPGFAAWERYEAQLFGHGGTADDHGWSYADVFQGVDDGGVAGDVIPAVPAPTHLLCVWGRVRVRLCSKCVLMCGYTGLGTGRAPFIGFGNLQRRIFLPLPGRTSVKYPVVPRTSVKYTCFFIATVARASN